MFRRHLASALSVFGVALAIAGCVPVVKEPLPQETQATSNEQPVTILVPKAVESKVVSWLEVNAPDTAVNTINSMPSNGVPDIVVGVNNYFTNNGGSIDPTEPVAYQVYSMLEPENPNGALANSVAEMLQRNVVPNLPTPAVPPVTTRDLFQIYAIDGTVGRIGQLCCSISPDDPYCDPNCSIDPLSIYIPGTDNQTMLQEWLVKRRLTFPVITTPELDNGSTADLFIFPATNGSNLPAEGGQVVPTGGLDVNCGSFAAVVVNNGQQESVLQGKEILSPLCRELLPTLEIATNTGAAGASSSWAIKESTDIEYTIRCTAVGCAPSSQP